MLNQKRVGGEQVGQRTTSASLYDYFMRNTQPAIWLTLLTTALSINPVRAQSGEQIIQEGTGFYTDTCQVNNPFPSNMNY